MQAAVLTRNAMLDAFATNVGTLFTLEVWTGSVATVGGSEAGNTQLATLTAGTFPSSASGGAIGFNATADSLGDNYGTPGHVVMKASGGTAKANFTAGKGTVATMGAATVVTNAVTTVAVTDGGTGYVDGVPYPLTFTGGTPERVAQGYIKTSTSGILATVTITDGGAGYDSSPTVTVGPPYEFTFTDTVYLGGQVSLQSATLTAGNA